MTVNTLPGACTPRGNCIPCAMWHTKPSLRIGTEAALQDVENEIHRKLASAGHYRACAALVGADLKPACLQRKCRHFCGVAKAIGLLMVWVSS